MTTSKTDLRCVLVSLLELARADVPATVDRLALRLALPEPRVRAALERLARDGLADAMRVRLTIVGLAIAGRIACSAETRRRASVSALAA